MKHAGSFALIGSLVVALLTGCGGNVTVEHEGADGGGGGGNDTAAGGGTAGGAGTTDTTDTTTPVDPEAHCGDLCTQLNSQGCFAPGGTFDGCFGGCTGLYEKYPECAAEITALHQCVLDHLPELGCDYSSECETQQKAFSTCA